MLDQIHLEMKKGDFLYVIGGSGAGKSSLLRLIATEEAPSEGAVSLFGYDLATVSPTTLRAIRQSIGYLPQDVRLIPDLSVFDNVALSLSLAGRRACRASPRPRSSMFSRSSVWAQNARNLPRPFRGEAQRVALARALVRSPELIVADEPTGAQDRDFTYGMMDLILKANLGGATILVRHMIVRLRRVRKRCAILRDGRIEVEEGGPQLCTF